MQPLLRQTLKSVVTRCRKLLEDSVTRALAEKYGIRASEGRGAADVHRPAAHLTEGERQFRRELITRLDRIQTGFAAACVSADAFGHFVREIAFTHLNRLCALKMMEACEVDLGGMTLREVVSQRVHAHATKPHLTEPPHDFRLVEAEYHEFAYRLDLDGLRGRLSQEIVALFDPNDPANRLSPRQATLDRVVALLNRGGIRDKPELGDAWQRIWSQEETIGWVYQYFTPKQLRDRVRKESHVPRDSYELAVRNQFFTPRYVVEFLVDNTLGRIWYEMRKGDTKLVDQCRYRLGGSHPYRPKKDPRELKILDPACGSGNFLLYCFDLLLTIYEEAYFDPELGPSLRAEYPTLGDLQWAVPALILRHNLYGIDIDRRATQVASLALWLRCQRHYRDLRHTSHCADDSQPSAHHSASAARTATTLRSNVVCAEPLAFDERSLKGFADRLEPKLLGQLVMLVFERMRLAGETGSLLKIDKELADAVASAKTQWLDERAAVSTTRARPRARTRDQNSTSRDGHVERLASYDVAGIDDEGFFDQAGHCAIEALRQYADQEGNERRIGPSQVDDDSRGLAFVEMCYQRFDVILMNPPFGDTTKSASSYLDKQYKETKDDLATQFAERFSAVLTPNGCLGILSTRTWLFLKRFGKWRTRLLSQYRLIALADLGYGVLDAVVETAAVIWQRSTVPMDAWFVSALRDSNKALALRDPGRVSQGNPDAFLKLPWAVIAYWLPPELVSRYSALPKVSVDVAQCFQGIATADDFRFLRLAWEVPIEQIVTDGTAGADIDGWVPVAKGGEYRPYYDDIHLRIDWRNNGAQIKDYVTRQYPYLNGDWNWVVKNSAHYFKPALTWSYRTTSAFCLKVLPQGCIFSVGGWSLIANDDHAQGRAELLAIYNSRLGRYFMELSLGQGDTSASGTAARNYGTESVTAAPWLRCDRVFVQACVDRLIEWQRDLDQTDETSSIFAGIRLGDRSTSLTEQAIGGFHEYLRGASERLRDTLAIQVHLEQAAQLGETDKAIIYEQEGKHPCQYARRESFDSAATALWCAGMDHLITTANERAGGLRHTVKKAHFIDRRLELICHILRAHPESVVDDCLRNKVTPAGWIESHAKQLISYLVGSAFGRWDIRLLMRNDWGGRCKDAFAPLPVFPPAMLQNGDRLPAGEPPTGYPLTIAREGILVDDPQHTRDIVRNVRRALTLLWHDRAETIEAELCQLLGVARLRDYFRKPTQGGFWRDHVRRYSKSRRKAPLYWLLQSSSKHYALWLYYPRLDKTLLPNVLANYVEPKLRSEEARLEALGVQRSTRANSGNDRRRLDHEIRRQDNVVVDLRDFEVKLRRAAALQLDPDLNDGVVLNIAPLYELVPWKEAKHYWDELGTNKYPWSSIARQL